VDIPLYENTLSSGNINHKDNEIDIAIDTVLDDKKSKSMRSSCLAVTYPLYAILTSVSL
jgi:hypothetical protein